MYTQELLVVVLLFFAAGCKPSADVSAAKMSTYDEPLIRPINDAHLKKGLVVKGLQDEDLKGMLAALSRTPDIGYEVLSITCFPPPPHPFPVAAELVVDHRNIYVCKGRDDKWHVFRIARLEN
jgi:hypothetical protein